MNITLTIDDHYKATFLAFIKTLSYVQIKEKKNDMVIPEKHKSLVKERMKNTKPDELLDWDEVKNNFKLD